MSRPLLPTTRLISCPSCAEHIKSGESKCPHCGAGQRGADGCRGLAATAVVVGLTLGGCPGPVGGPTDSGARQGDAAPPASRDDDAPIATPEPEYGVPVEPAYGLPPAPEPPRAAPRADVTRGDDPPDPKPAPREP